MKTECESDLIKLEDKIYPCTVSLVMDLMGGKWKAVILYHLKDNSKRYNELRKEMPTVTERTLSLQLKQLEEDGLVFRICRREETTNQSNLRLNRIWKIFQNSFRFNYRIREFDCFQKRRIH